MDKTWYWLSFDLGLHGNYEELYEWLDAQDARECGDSVAAFKSEKTREKLAEEISERVGANLRARVYLIDMKQHRFLQESRGPALTPLVSSTS